MYILTNRLVSMRGDAIPLPWYQRAPLGLLSGTPVHVALQLPRNRPFGDLLVSAVDPVNWPYVTEVRTSRKDEPGVLAEVYRGAAPLNIVFAEAVTVDSGLHHDVRLVLEPFHRKKAIDKFVAKRIGKLERRLRKRKGFSKPVSTKLHEDLGKLGWMEVGSVEHGWANVAGWRDAVRAQAKLSARADSYDLDMAVVFADTDRRMLRYVFPRKGAITISVEHADRPGAMWDIANALAGKDLNVLSSLLRRGSAPHGKAEVVFVVEPTRKAKAATSRVKAALASLPVELRINKPEILGAVDPEHAVLYPRRPHEIAVRPSGPMEAMILAVKETLPRGPRPIFISRRFIDNSKSYNRRVVEELARVLEKHGFVAVEALPQPGAETVVSDEVKAKMWACDAAILLVMSTPDDRQFSENLAHECGFMQGQGKRLLPLVQQGTTRKITRNANLQGLQQATFSKKLAFERKKQGSIHEAVCPWLKLLEGSNHVS
jgi:hypothetical protein